MAGVIEYNEKLSINNAEEYQKLLKILKKAVYGELTNRQKQCITLYYFNRLTVTQIADNIGVGKSTVSRHISKAKDRLHKVLNYYQNLK